MTMLIFDIDDTLYDQLIPFSSALKKNFAIYDECITRKIFTASRECSDQLFLKSESGIISKKNMHIFRIKEAMRQNNFVITEKEAHQFQTDYEKFQNKITIRNDMLELLNYCLEKDVSVGVITNGPSKHQHKKIENLKLNNWFNPDNIIVSGDIGVAKPDSEIFKEFENRQNKNIKKYIYIGDSFENDVVGAMNVGWDVIWYNVRNKKIVNKEYSPQYVVTKDVSLLELVKKILG